MTMFELMDEISRIEGLPMPHAERDRMMAPLLERLRSMRIDQEVRAQHRREFALLLLEMQAGK